MLICGSTGLRQLHDCQRQTDSEQRHQWTHSEICVCISRLVVSNSLQPQGLQSSRLSSLWNSPGKNIGAGCHFLLQGIFPTQGSNLGLLHCRQMLYHLSQQGNPIVRCAVTQREINSNRSEGNKPLWREKVFHKKDPGKRNLPKMMWVESLGKDQSTELRLLQKHHF